MRFDLYAPSSLEGLRQPFFNQFGNKPPSESAQDKLREAVLALDAPSQLATFSGLGKPSLGLDPEVFVAKGDGSLWPAFEFLPAQKERVNTGDVSAHAVPYWDGYQAEFTVSAGACIALRTDSIQMRLRTLRELMHKHDSAARLLAQDTVAIDLKAAARLPEVYTRLGCDPSYHVYQDQGDLPEDGLQLPIRVAGGHIHFGSDWLTDGNKERISQIVKDLDRCLAVWSVGAAASWEASKLRRRYYGLAGEFRLPKHGLEYRVLSNFFLASPEMTHITLEIARMIVRASAGGFMKFWKCDPRDAQAIVNAYDKEGAAHVLKENERLFKMLLGMSVNYWHKHDSKENAWASGNVEVRERAVNKAFAVGIEGMELVTPKPGNMFENWYLDDFETNNAHKGTMRSWRQLISRT